MIVATNANIRSQFMEELGVHYRVTKISPSKAERVWKERKNDNHGFIRKSAKERERRTQRVETKKTEVTYVTQFVDTGRHFYLEDS